MGFRSNRKLKVWDSDATGIRCSSGFRCSTKPSYSATPLIVLISLKWWKSTAQVCLTGFNVGWGPYSTAYPKLVEGPCPMCQKRTRLGARVHKCEAHSGLLWTSPLPESSQVYVDRKILWEKFGAWRLCPHWSVGWTIRIHFWNVGGRIGSELIKVGIILTHRLAS